MSPWQFLEYLPSLVAVRSVWAAETGGKFQAFNTLCLEPDDWQVESFPCPRECGCWHRVILRHDAPPQISPFEEQPVAAGVCRCNPPQCPDIPLTGIDITPLKLSWTRLGRELCRALALSSKFAESPPPNTFQIGAWSTDAVPVILTIQNEHHELREVIAELGLRLHQKPFILLAPTNNLLTAPCHELLADAHAGFFALENIVTLTDQGALKPARAPAEIFAAFTPETERKPTLSIAKPRYALRKGLGVWHLTFDGEEAVLKHERGIFYVAWLLYNPPEYPIHAVDLMGKVPEIYRQQLGLPELTDPATGEVTALQRDARIEERSLALDDVQAMRALFKKAKELEGILDSDDESEPVKAEALRDLEAIYELQRQGGRRSRDNAWRVAHGVRSAIARFHERLRGAVGEDGNPHPIFRSFAEHIYQYILIPSARYGGRGGPHARAGLAGCFTYERPGEVLWKK